MEDTHDVSFEEIGNWFGSAVRRIVEGETRFSKIGKISGMTPGADVKAEDLRQLFLAMTEEVRIIVVKLADRLHNMRTLGSMKPEKQKKIAAETLQVGVQAFVHRHRADSDTGIPYRSQALVWTSSPPPSLLPPLSPSPLPSCGASLLVLSGTTGLLQGITGMCHCT